MRLFSIDVFSLFPFSKNYIKACFQTPFWNPVQPGLYNARPLTSSERMHPLYLNRLWLAYSLLLRKWGNSVPNSMYTPNEILQSPSILPPRTTSSSSTVSIARKYAVAVQQCPLGLILFTNAVSFWWWEKSLELYRPSAALKGKVSAKPITATMTSARPCSRREHSYKWVEVRRQCLIDVVGLKIGGSSNFEELMKDKSSICPDKREARLSEIQSRFASYPSFSMWSSKKGQVLTRHLCRIRAFCPMFPQTGYQSTPQHWNSAWSSFSAVPFLSPLAVISITRFAVRLVSPWPHPSHFSLAFNTFWICSIASLNFALESFGPHKMHASFSWLASTIVWSLSSAAFAFFNVSRSSVSASPKDSRSRKIVATSVLAESVSGWSVEVTLLEVSRRHCTSRWLLHMPQNILWLKQMQQGRMLSSLPLSESFDAWAQAKQQLVHTHPSYNSKLLRTLIAPGSHPQNETKTWGNQGDSRHWFSSALSKSRSSFALPPCTYLDRGEPMQFST